MKSLPVILFFLCLAAPLFLQAQVADNAGLTQMFEKDQRSRLVSKIDWARLTKEDSIRRMQVCGLIDSNRIITGQDYYHSAMIFQHGMDTSDFAMAMQHMKKAIALDSTINKWLLAAATDRYLMNLDKPQIYGTQYTRQYEKDAKWERYKMDSTQVTDAERRYYGVETLAEQQNKVREMNLLSITAFYDSTKSLDRTIRLVGEERRKGSKAAYSTSEESLNTFGYELMTAGNDAGALKIFLLNTGRYPKSSNAFDSFGECLLKLNHKNEAIRAYQKALALNPHNGNARKVLSGLR